MCRRVSPLSRGRLNRRNLLLGLVGPLILVALPVAAYHASPGVLTMASWVTIVAGTVGLVAMAGVLLVTRRRESVFDRELRQLIEMEASRWR